MTQEESITSTEANGKEHNAYVKEDTLRTSLYSEKCINRFSIISLS